MIEYCDFLQMLLKDVFKHQKIQVSFVILLCKNKLAVVCVWIK